MRQSIDDVELFYGNLINLVENVETRDVHATLVLDGINELLDRGVLITSNVGRIHLVLLANACRNLEVENRLPHRRRERDTTLVPLLEHNVGRLLVQSNAKAFQLVFDETFVGDGFESVEHDHDEITRLGGADNRSTPTLAVLGAFDDTRKIEQLNARALVSNETRHGSDCGELVLGGRRVRAGELR